MLSRFIKRKKSRSSFDTGSSRRSDSERTPRIRSYIKEGIRVTFDPEEREKAKQLKLAEKIKKERVKADNLEKKKYELEQRRKLQKRLHEEKEREREYKREMRAIKRSAFRSNVRPLKSTLRKGGKFVVMMAEDTAKAGVVAAKGLKQLEKDYRREFKPTAAKRRKPRAKAGVKAVKKIKVTRRPEKPVFQEELKAFPEPKKIRRRKVKRNR